jgi:hypothetical protein
VTTVLEREQAHSDRPLLLTIPDRPHGPVVTRLLRRTWIGAAVLWAIAGSLVAAPIAAEWHAFGLGLFIPGAGFIAAGGWIIGPVLFAVTAVVFVLSLVAWFGSGMIVAPPIVVLAAAGLATLRVDGDNSHDAVRIIIPAAVVVAVVAGLIGSRRAFRAAQARGRQRNTYLAGIRLRPADPVTNASFRELDERELLHQRWLLDLALQPVEQFRGFDFVDQFQTAAVRYQLNMASYGLALNQYVATPNFHGPLSLAQRNLIAKMQLRPVWSYWRWENLWGNFDPNPDPIRRDNIMLSGYLGVMLAAYQANTGDNRYSQPGALTFTWNDRRSFSYSFQDIAAAIHHNLTRYDIGLFPCEPNWIYSACNTFGMNSLMVADRLHGTDHFSQTIDAFRRGIEQEFATPDGRVTAIRSSRLGLTIPSLTSTMADLSSAMFLHGILPDVSQRLWAVGRRELIRMPGEGDVHPDVGAPPQIDIELRGWDKIDVGTYKPSDIMAYTTSCSAAREMGDEELVDLLRSHLRRDIKPGDRPLAELSTMANAMFSLGMLSRRDGWRDMMTTPLPDGVRSGPVLEDVPHPDVQVAYAVSDGSGLDLVLHPDGTPTRARLGVSRLEPQRSYLLRGALTPTITADGAGNAFFDVDVAGRTSVQLVAS